MKLHLPLLLLSVLSAWLASADSLYMADGVNKDDITASARCYDNGKGYYWTAAGSQAYTGARALYNATGGFAFMGSLEKRLGSNMFSASAFAPLKADEQACWYYTASNVLEYWDGTFGVFCHDRRELPFGYTYSPDYADELAGTQSLFVGMVFYDNAYNVPGNFSVAADWFLKGTDDADCIRTRGQGGYFADYFRSIPASTYVLFTDGTTYINERPKGIVSFQTELYEALGVTAQDGGFVRTHEGRIAYLGLAASDGVGHAITCYGFETDAEGTLTTLYITNSDDRKYNLQTVYVKEDSFRNVHLYTDAACNLPWVYASRQWNVDEIAYINTPQKLEELYTAYSAPETPLLWNGCGGEVWSADVPKGKLPDSSTGWVAVVEGERFASFAGADRILCCDDSAASGQVSVVGNVSAAELRLQNSARDYVFSGSGASITAPVTISGSGSAGFNGVSLKTLAADVAGYKLSVAEGAALAAESIRLQSGAVLALDAASADVATALTLGNGAVLEIASVSSLSASSLNLQDGSALRFALSADTADTPLLSYSGSVTLSGTVSIQFANTRYEGNTRYALMSCAESNPADWLGSLICSAGTLSVSHQVLYFTSGADASVTHEWTDSFGTLKAGCTIGKHIFAEDDKVEFRNPRAAVVTLSGEVQVGELSVKTDQNVTLNADFSNKGYLAGEGSLVKEGKGTLSLCNGNTYSGGTTLREGTLRAMGNDSFGSGGITVCGGTLDLGFAAVGNEIVVDGAAVVRGGYQYAGHLTVKADLLSGSSVNLAQNADLCGGTISGTMSGKGGVVVNGDVTIKARQSYKGTTTVQSGTLSLSSAAALTGNIVVNGGTLAVLPPTGFSVVKGLSLGMGQMLDIRGGMVKGDVTAGYNATIRLSGGVLQTSPTLAGGTLDMGGSGRTEFNCALGGLVSVGSQEVALKGRGVVLSDDSLCIRSGSVTIQSRRNVAGDIVLDGGSVSLSGTTACADDIVVRAGRTASVSNGMAHHGNIIVDGSLARGTIIRLLDNTQRVELNGNGSLQGMVSGKGCIHVNAVVDAGTSMLAADTVMLNHGGELTLANGAMLMSGKEYAFNGGTLRCGRGTLTTFNGGCLSVTAPSSLSGNLTLLGGSLVFADGASLAVSGKLSLTLGTALTLSGNWEAGSRYTLMTFGSVQQPLRGSLEDFFRVEEGVTLRCEDNALVLITSAARRQSIAEPLAFAPDDSVQEEPAAALAEEPLPLSAEPLAAAPAWSLPVSAAVADALVQADWGIAAADRAFGVAVKGQRDSGALFHEQQGAVWLSALGGVQRQGHRGTHQGAEHNLSGAAVGVEHRAGQGAALGLALGRTQNRMAVQGLSRVRQESAHFALYAQQALPHGFAAEATLTYADSDSRADWYGDRRTWSQRSATAEARLTHQRPLGDKGAVRPFLSLGYEGVGSGSSADFRTGSVQNLRGSIGADVSYALSSRVHLMAGLTLTGDMLRRNPTADVVGYRAEGSNPGRIGLQLNLGASARLSESWSADFGYMLQAVEQSTSQGVHVGARRSF